MSQTQLSNYAAVFGVAVLILQKLGIVVSQDQLMFIVAAAWTVGWQAYSFIQRYKKGDLTVLGLRK